MKCKKYLFLPPFLTRYIERMLEAMSKNGYGLVSVERDGLFGYRFFFEPSAVPPRRYYVYRIEDSRKDRYNTRCDEERRMLGERCCEPVYQDSFVLIASVSADTADAEINTLISNRLNRTSRYYLMLMLSWFVFVPLLFVLGAVVTGTDIVKVLVAWPILVPLALYSGAMALYCQWERYRLR